MLLLCARQTRGQCITRLLEVGAFLLGFPVIPKDFFYSVLVKLKFLGQLLDPDDLADHFRKVSHLVERVVDLVLIQHLHLQLFNVFVNLGQQLRLVLGDCASDFGTHEELVVDSEDLEHFVGVTGTLKFLFE